MEKQVLHCLLLVLLLAVMVPLRYGIADGIKADEIKPVAVVQTTLSGPVVYDQHIRPILVKKCFVCHSGNVTEGGLDVGSHRGLLAGGDRGASIQPGKADESLLIKAAGRTGEPLMPPPDEADAKPLTPEELAILKLWVNQGAKPPATTRKVLRVTKLPASVQVVRAIAVAADKSQLVASRANQLHAYNAAGEFVRSLVDPELAQPAATEAAVQPDSAAHRSVVDALAFSPDGRLLASGALHEVKVWQAVDGALKHRLGGFAHRVVALDISPDGRLLAAAGGPPTVAGEVRVFDLASGEMVLELADAHSDTIFGVRFSPDGDKLATCGGDQSIKILELPDGKLIKTLEGHTHHVLDVAWQADGRLLASAGADKKVRLWDYETGEQLTRIQRGGGQISTIFLDHDAQVSRLLFLGREAQILTCSGNRPAKLWQLSMQLRPGNYAKPYLQARLAQSFGDGSDYLFAIGASPDGQLVASGGHRGVVWLYDGSAKLVKPLLPPGVEPPIIQPPVDSAAKK